jgi:hypothetical protein
MSHRLGGGVSTNIPGYVFEQQKEDTSWLRLHFDEDYLDKELNKSQYEEHPDFNIQIPQLQAAN